MSMDARNYPFGICRVYGSSGRVLGLGFAVDREHILTCGHVVNSASGRQLRDETWPDPPAVLRIDFPIGMPHGETNERESHLTRWLPVEGPFDAFDMAVLRVAGGVPSHVPSPRFADPSVGGSVQMWGPQPDRPDGVYVTGKLLGAVIGGRLQVETDGRQFRARPGFSGGPVWDAQTGHIVGILTACGAGADAVDAYVLELDRVLGRWWGSLGDAATPESADDLLARVLEAARYHPHLQDATTRLVEAQRPHEVTHLRATKQRKGITGHVLGSSEVPIGVHAGAVTPEAIDHFADAVAARYQIGGADTESILVYSGDPANAELTGHANLRGINLLSFVEFQGGYDLRPFAERQSRQLESDPVYQPKSYIPQRYYEYPERRVRPDRLLERIINWLAEPEGHLVIVLAPFGHGKTFLLHEVARRMHEQRHPAIPVLVRLRDLEKAHSIDELLVTQLTKSGERRIDLDRLRYLRHEGRVALLFDGFDELAVKATYDSVTAHLATLIGAAEGRAKLVVTSRREYFLSDRDVELAMGERLATVAGRRIVSIAGFDTEQVDRFLTNKFGQDKARQWLALLQDLELMELAATPRMLEFITAIPEETLTAVTIREGVITRAIVFDQILEFWLEFEQQRLSVGGTISGPSKENLLAAVTGLAVRLWVSAQEDLGVQELGAGGLELIRLAPSGTQAAAMEPGEAAQVLGSATLLIRTGEGRFGFVHRSVMEYLVAVEATNQLRAGQKLPEILRMPLSPLVIEFFEGLAGRAAVTDWIIEALSDPADSSRTNALEVATQLGITTTQRLRMASQDLRGRNLEGRANFAQADFRNANLTEARLARLNLTGADFSGAILVRARLDEANLSQAILSGADLTGARLLGADLTGVDWEGVTSLRRATALGARLDERARQVLAAHGVAYDNTSATVETLPSEAPVEAVAYDPTGALIAAACGDGTVRIWDEAMGYLIRVLNGQCGPTLSVTWSPDGAQLISGAADGQILVWELQTGSLLRTLTHHEASVLSLSWSPDGTQLASGSADGHVVIWEAATGRRVRVLKGVYGSVFAVAWSPAGDMLAVSGDSNRLTLWRPNDFAPCGELAASRGWVRCLAWSPDGRQLASAGEDQQITVWDPNQLQHLRTLGGHNGPVYALSWSADGTRLASGATDSVRIWQMPSGRRDQLMLGHSGRCTSVTFSPSGEHLVTGDDRSVRISTTATGELARSLAGARVGQTAVAWSPDGKFVASGGEDRVIRIWSRWTGALHRSLVGHRGPVAGIAWSADANLLATTSRDGTMHVWSASSGFIRTTMSGYGTPAWAPQDRTLAVGDNQLVRVLDIDDPRSRTPLQEHSSTVVAVAWSPDGSLLASAGADGQVIIWERATWRPKLTLDAHRGAVTSLLWAADGQTLITAGADRMIQFWRPDRFAPPVRTVGVFNHGVTNIALTPDGHTLAVVGEDQTLSFYGPESPKPLDDLRYTAGAVHCVQWSPHGKLIALGSGSGMLHLARWPDLTRVADLLALADDGWAAFLEGLSYKSEGVPRREYWYALGLNRFEAGALDDYVTGLRRVPTGQPLAPEIEQFGWSAT